MRKAERSDRRDDREKKDNRREESTKRDDHERSVRFSEDTQNIERSNKKPLIPKSAMKEHLHIEKNQKEEKNQRKREKKESADNGEENDQDVREQAERSRRKKRRMLANVRDSESSDNDYEGEEKPDEDVFEEEWHSGITLEAFNLKEEYRDGVIDLSSGSISTRKAKEEEEDEDWLKEHDQNMKDDSFVTKMERNRRKWEEQNANFDKENTFTHADSIQLLEEASDLLFWGETVGKALNRLRPKVDNTTKKSKNSTIRPSKEEKEKPKEETPFERLTNCADKLLNAEGLVDIYTSTKEDLLDYLEKIKSNYVTWEYKWPNAEEVYGPESNDKMKGWLEEGYFSFEVGKYILVRKIIEGTPVGEFIPLVDNFF